MFVCLDRKYHVRVAFAAVVKNTYIGGCYIGRSFLNFYFSTLILHLCFHFVSFFLFFFFSFFLCFQNPKSPKLVISNSPLIAAAFSTSSADADESCSKLLASLSHVTYGINSFLTSLVS